MRKTQSLRRRWKDRLRTVSLYHGREKEEVLPLMAVFQATKKKLRPALDYCELNRFMACHTRSDIIDVCDEKMRKWRRLEGGTAIVDLKSAYLLLHVAKEL